MVVPRPDVGTALFLARELRRRAAQSYHDAAYLREHVFRQDLNALFADRRFVTSDGRIELKRDVGNIRTDIDAVVFDRKTGTLGTFELKSQDPFARSSAELARQRDNLLFANRQVSATLTWFQQNGADEILNRVDRQTAKRFRVQRVYPFVLGRYLAQFNDGQAPDRRAAWGAWPQVLRLFAERSVQVADANPIASLFSRLNAQRNDGWTPGERQAHEIPVGATRLTLYSSWTAYQAGARGAS